MKRFIAIILSMLLVCCFLVSVGCSDSNEGENPPNTEQPGDNGGDNTGDNNGGTGDGGSQTPGTGDNTGDEGTGDGSTDNNTQNVGKYFTNPLRDYTAPETQNYMVKDGKTDYVLVIPEDSTDNILTARDEFVELFRKATDITLKVIRDTNLTHSNTAKYISLGETTLLATSGITIDKDELGRDGLRIITKDQSVYVAGGSDYGVLYGVYTFMEITFNYDTYWMDCLEIDTGVTDLKLRDYKVVDTPDFYERCDNYGMYYNKSTDYDESHYKTRMKVSGQRGGNFMPVYQVAGDAGSTPGASTNAKCYLPNDETKYLDNEWGTFKTYWDNYNKYWFSDNGDQFCYTGHGNQEAYDAMIEICAAKICFSLTQYTPQSHPQYNIVTLTQQDNTAVCTCESCNNAKAKYGGVNSGALCVFNNKVMAKVVEWMNKPENEEYKRDDLILIFFAYAFSVDAPVTKTESGEFIPAHQDVVLRDDVGIYYANGYFEFQKPLEDPINDKERDNTKGWGVVSKNIYTWLYSAIFRDFMYMYDSIDFFSDGFNFFASQSRNMMFSQAQDQSQGTATAWYNLKAYLDAKLMWDSSLDTNQLIDKYFDAMFQDASDTMKTFFFETRTHVAYINETYNMYHVVSNTNRPANATYWPVATMERWLELCDKAISEIEYLKTTNYDLYISTLNHIETEALSPLYILVQLHGGSLQSTVKTAYLDRMQDTVYRMGCGLMRTSEHGGSLQEWIDSNR